MSHFHLAIEPFDVQVSIPIKFTCMMGTYMPLLHLFHFLFMTFELLLRTVAKFPPVEREEE